MGAEGSDTRAWSGRAQHHLGRQAGEVIITVNVLRIRAQVYMGNGARMGKEWFSVDGSGQTVSPMSVFLRLDTFVGGKMTHKIFPEITTPYISHQGLKKQGVFEKLYDIWQV